MCKVKGHHSPGPLFECKSDPHDNVSREQSGVETAMEEQPLGEKAPVDRPLEKELSAQIKGASYVTNWVSEEEGRAQEELDGGTEKEERERATPAVSLKEKHQKTRRE